jgi:hypothetical protein
VFAHSALVTPAASAYYLICLAAGLLAIAAASRVLVWRLRPELRQASAVALLDALARSSDWAAAQARALCFQAPTQASDPALAEFRALQVRGFPELTGIAHRLCYVHLQLVALLEANERQRLDDPEAWLDSGDHTAFVALSREYGALVGLIEQRLEPLAVPAAAQPQFL